MAYTDRGVAWSRKSDLDRAINDYTKAIRLDPSDAVAYGNRGIAWFEKGDMENAIRDLTEAIRLDPENSAAYQNRGSAWYSKGNFFNAVKDYSEAIRLKPTIADAYYNRGIAWAGNGDLDSALKDYNEAVRLNPKDAHGYAGLASLFATSRYVAFRGGARAIEQAKKACELTEWKDPSCLSALAAAYAEQGEFQEAIRWQEKAIALATESDKKAMQERLDLYKAGKPFRDGPKR
jgi:tetratricopeptide (TPR) repeat protein